MTATRAAAVPLASAAKLLADPTRLQILTLIAAAANGVTVSELGGKVHVSQPTVSYHVQKLLGAGWLSCEPDGQFNVYRLNRDRVREARDAIGGLLR